MVATMATKLVKKYQAACIGKWASHIKHEVQVLDIQQDVSGLCLRLFHIVREQTANRSLVWLVSNNWLCLRL